MQIVTTNGAWTSIERSMAEMSDPLLTSVLDYWQGLRRARAMPRRPEIDPVALLRPSVPHLLLVSVEGRDFRYDLVGTAIEEQFGMSVAGRLLKELPFEPDRNALFTQHRATVWTRRPTYREYEIVNAEGKAVQCRRLLLPLSADGTIVTDLFGMWLFLPFRPRPTKAVTGSA